MFKLAKSFLLVIIVFMVGCKTDHNTPVNASANPFQKIIGKTMGTTYSVVLEDKALLIKQAEIDSILKKINESLSTYIDTSLISKINKNDFKSYKKVELLIGGQLINRVKIKFQHDDHLVANLAKSERIYLDTKGHFDPTVMPLVNYWGFGYTPKKAVAMIDSLEVKKRLEYVGFDKIEFTIDHDSITIIKPENAQLDFSAIAKGYAVDKVAEFLDSTGIENYMTEIGGEVKCKGNNSKGTPWKVALNTPDPDAARTSYAALIQLNSGSIASSGNYRNYYEVKGIKYGHEINPFNGLPQMTQLLGVSVFHSECMVADALATAFMIMQWEDALEYVENYPGLEALFFVSNSKGEIEQKMSTGFADLVI